MADCFMGQRETIAAFHQRVLLRIEALVDHDPGLVEEHRAEDVGVQIEAGARHAEQAVSVVELDAELKVFLDDILDRDRWLDSDATRLRVFGQQRRRIALDHLLGKVGNKLGHVIRILFCICIVETDTA